jgi:hypothetical protein
MGTRSLTYVYENYKDEQGNKVEQPIICLYRQYDGYPVGHGAELADYLNGMYVVNGLGLDQKDQKVANGMGCLAAQLVSFFKKDEAGQFYLHAPVLNADHWQEYEYHIQQDRILVYGYDKEIFSGTWSEYFAWILEQVKLEAKEVA